MRKKWTAEEVARGDDQFIANGIRLTGRGWLLVASLAVLTVLIAPTVWRWVEPFDPGPDYRVPHQLSDDYWLYDHWARVAASEVDTLVVGDSVVWGEYVKPDGTLSHYLNERAGERRFANLGLAGMHPAPLAGLIEYYGGAISGKDVILHCNPLWMSSPRVDLRGEKEYNFNHYELVPQFSPRIACYTRKDSERVGFVAKRMIPFWSWKSHLYKAYFDDQDDPEKGIAGWMVKHPYEYPFQGALLAPSTTPRQTGISWEKRGIKPHQRDWVDLETSLQWRFFQRTVEILRERGNRLFVLVGPFNEHMLTEPNRERYAEVKRTIVDWLKEAKVPHLAPDPLPSELYGDASHPLAEGYALLAKQLYDNRLSLKPDNPLLK